MSQASPSSEFRRRNHTSLMEDGSQLQKERRRCRQRSCRRHFPYTFVHGFSPKPNERHSETAGAFSAKREVLPPTLHKYADAMLTAVPSLAVEVQQQDDLRYRWTLSRPNGRVIDEGVELYIASCLASATVEVAEPTSRISVTVDGFFAGDFLAARTQLESSAVALEIAQAMLTRRP